MTKYYIRVITSKYDLSLEEQLVHSIRKQLLDLNICDISFQNLVPYWKADGCGELNCQFHAADSLESIQNLFAAHWDCNTADSRWSDIYLPHTSFLWISD